MSNDACNSNIVPESSISFTERHRKKSGKPLHDKTGYKASDALTLPQQKKQRQPNKVSPGDWFTEDDSLFL